MYQSPGVSRWAGTGRYHSDLATNQDLATKSDRFILVPKADIARRTRRMSISGRISWLLEKCPKSSAPTSIACLCCTALLLTSLTVHSQDGVGGGIIIGVTPKNYNGSCPVVVHFQARVLYGLAHSRVRYHWERGNGESTPQRSGELPDGKLEVSDEFSVGVPGHTFVATDRLHILFDGDKEEVVSSKIETRGTCLTSSPD